MCLQTSALIQFLESREITRSVGGSPSSSVVSNGTSSDSSRMFASGTRFTLRSSSSLRICTISSGTNSHNSAGASLIGAKLYSQRTESASNGVCSNKTSTGSNTDTRALLSSGGNYGNQNANCSIPTSNNNDSPREAGGSADSTANASVNRRASNSVTNAATSSATGATKARNTSHHDGPRRDSQPCCSEANGSEIARTVSVGLTILSRLRYCHSCFSFSSRSWGSACANGGCRGSCCDERGARRSCGSTRMCRCSKYTSSSSGSSSGRESSRGDREAYSSCRDCGNMVGGYHSGIGVICTSLPHLRFASAGIWRASSKKRRGDEMAATCRLTGSEKRYKNRSKTKENAHGLRVPRGNSSQSVFHHHVSESTVATGSLSLADTREGQVSSVDCTRIHLLQEGALSKCNSAFERGGKLFFSSMGGCKRMCFFFSHFTTSRRRGGMSIDVSVLTRARAVFPFSPHSLSLFHSHFFPRDYSHLLYACPSSPFPSPALGCSPSSPFLPSYLFTSCYPSQPCSSYSALLAPAECFRSFCLPPPLSSSFRFPFVSSLFFLCFGRCLSTGRSGRRGYMFDPIADASETEPEVVVKLDELAMVQLKTLLLPTDLRQRLEQLLRNTGRKQDIEKVGKLLIAKYTARSSVELPRVLPSQLFAAAAAGARRHEEQGEDPAPAMPVDPEKEEMIRRREHGLSLPEEAQLQQEALASAEDQRHRLFRKLAGSHSPLTAAAYTAHRYAGVYGSMVRILHEIKLRAPDFLPEHVLEMHAGFAAGLAAAARVWTAPCAERNSTSASNEEDVTSQLTAEQRDGQCENNCPVAVWRADASGTTSTHLPVGANGISANSASVLTTKSSPSERQCQQQVRTLNSSSLGHHQQAKQEKSVFKFLLAVERSSHLMTVGKFLTAELYPPVQWQMGLYEEGLGFSDGTEKTADLTARKDESNRREVPEASLAAGPPQRTDLSSRCRGQAALPAIERVEDTLKSRPADCLSTCLSQFRDCSNADCADIKVAENQRHRRRFDLIMLPHCLLSTADGWESMQQQIRTLWNRLAQGGILVLLERGTPTGFRVLHSVRELFIKELGVGKFHFVAPCPHESICPLALTGRDWCHFSQRVHRLPHHLYCKGSRAKNVEEEKFSFLVIRKMPGPRSRYACEAECRTPEERSYFWPRLVMPVIKGGQHCLLDLCAAPHSFERVAISKSMPHTAGYKCARKAHWGDLWRYPRRIIRPDARGYTDEQIRKHLLRLHRKTQQRSGSPVTARCESHGPATAAEDTLEAELKASFGW